MSCLRCRAIPGAILIGCGGLICASALLLLAVVIFSSGMPFVDRGAAIVQSAATAVVLMIGVLVTALV